MALVALFIVLFFTLNANAQNLNNFMSFANINWVTSSWANGDTVAWVQVKQGVANVFIASCNDGSCTSKQVTSYTQDEALDINTLTFSPDGKYLSFVAAPSDNSNPNSLVVPPVSNIYIYSVSSSNIIYSLAGYGFGAISSLETIVVTTGQSAYEVAFTSNQQLNLLFSVQSDQGYISDFTYSPDGSQLAFTSYRGDHSFVGIFTRGSSVIQWLIPSIDLDGQPTWSPDGTKVAFYRFYEVDDEYDRTNLTQYSIFVVTLATGGAIEIFNDTKVGFPVTYGFGVRPLTWFDDDTVLFPCEFSMWLHVCASPAYGWIPTKELVTGECEVQDYIPYGGYVYVSHNCDLIDTLSISQINPHTMQNTTIFEGDYHNVAGVADGGFGMAPLSEGLAFIRTGYNFSTQLSLWNGNSQLAEISQDNFDGSLFVVPQPITFESLDKEFTIHAQLFMPHGVSMSDAASLPAIVFTHGGPMRQMYNAFHYCIDYAQLYALNQFFANNGFVVLSINYRMGVGYGKQFRDCTDCGAFGAAEYQDVLGGNKWLASQSFVDPTRIGIHGLSYGGLNCLQALSRNSDVFVAGVANAPVFNWLSQSRFDGAILYDYNPLMQYLPINIGPEPNQASPNWHHYVNANMKISWDSSPAGHIDTFTSPVLLIHGDSDRNVDFQETIGLARALRAKGNVKVQTLIFPNERHGLALYRNDVAAAVAAFNFLATNL